MEMTSPAPGGCFNHPNTPHQEYPCTSFKFPGQNWKTFRVPRLIKMLELNITHLPADTDASHLCGNKRCVNVSHIVLEPHTTNNQRIECHGAGHCIPDMKHEPKCIFKNN